MTANLPHATLPMRPSVLKPPAASPNHAAKDTGPSLGTKLRFAASMDEPWAVEQAIAAGAPIDEADSSGLAALGLAARRGSAACVRLLLAAGASVGAATSPQGERGGTPLALAILNGHVEIARELIDAGSDLASTDPHGWTLLMGACAHGRLASVALLLALGADPNVQSHDGSRALAVCAEAGALDCARLLLDAGADPEALDAAGADAAARATGSNALPMAQTLRAAALASREARELGAQAPSARAALGATRI